MEITDEQRKRAQANRLAAIAKRKALVESSNGQQQSHQPKCPKLSHSSVNHPRELARSDPVPDTLLPEKFRVSLEICSPDSFSVAPLKLRGFDYPGEEECLRRLNDCLSSVMPSHYTQNHGGGKACVYKVRDYGAVLKCLKSNKNVEVEEVPWATFNVVERFSHSFVAERWIPCRPEHFSEDKVDELIGELPKTLLEALLPFQLDGVKFGLRRGGRAGSVLIVCPAILRFSWAEELEHWVPFLLPADIHLVFGHQNNPVHLKRCPKVVVISYTMLHRLRKSMLEREWSLLIVDESHHVRCTKKAEPGETKAVLDMATKVKHVVLLSGTPSLSRPGLLGKNKFEFAKTYCDVKFVQGLEGKMFQDFSKGTRLEELNVLLKQTVMIRRLKEHVMLQLPPKRRQIIRIFLKRSDIVAAKDAVAQKTGDEITASEDISSKDLDEPNDGGDSHIPGQLSHQELGVAKLSGFCEWLSIHPLIADPDGATNLDSNSSSHKMIIFAHHHKVLNGVQEFICEKGIGFIRIDGHTLARDRQSAVLSFRSSTEVKIAIIGITAGGVGLDFSSAQHVVFLELPQSPSLMLQAEDRAHRRGQKNAVNIYIFCAKDTLDESHWQSLNKSLRRVSSTTNGKYDAIQEIEVEGVSFLETSCRMDSPEDKILETAECDQLSAQPLEFQDSALAKDTEPFEAYNEYVDKKTPRYKDKSNVDVSSTKTDYLMKATATPVVDVDKLDSVSEGKLEEKCSESKIGKCGRYSSSKLDEGNIIYPQMEEANEIVGADECCAHVVNSLRFEVSQYTGRIHLYSCISGTDSRPRPLFENFRPEELEPLNYPVADEDKINVNSFKDNPVYRNAVLEFSKEWNNLRPVERKRLIGKPLQLPLTVELCYLNESINHNTGGLIRVGSKRRHTPLYEISQALPSNAVWKKVYLHTGYGKKEKEYAQGWTLNDKPLCKLCQEPCKSSNAMEPEFFEDLFCNLECYEEYRIRTSNRSLRQELFQLENGICTNCQLDCHKLVVHIRPLSLAMRREHIEKVAPRIASRRKLRDKLIKDPKEGNAWHADHIVPVYRGGGECKLENMRTLCVACHSDVTKAQCAERRLTRANAKKQLKAFLNGLKDVQSNEQKDTNVKDQGQLEMQNVVEDELLVKVPGSAYSSGNNMGAGSEGSSTSKEISVSTNRI
ncbi:SNF2 domain-containing protein / helicase domain-containing protein / HNH endonuclease domain-containing protein [Trema orientale]|uniref:SNF2 domain-containing protein / helicase domain-containing protein / HNH endonuclease domain-containing protein n=1 Tax=Trema orientale TaxID=63057 RepID=A0A2P5FVY7_TREOI|nr:SNF2 domain-containing protein / helicase domain-containing protein / HNH endonuclease domain-containing protein [Trema orientale]